MIMKYKDFKKMNADEMKEVKGGMVPPPFGVKFKCTPTGPEQCVTANPQDCCPDPILTGKCPDPNVYC